MSILGKRQRWLACFLGGLFAAIAVSFAFITFNQTSAEAATNAWGTGTAITFANPRIASESASSHLEPNFYQ
jgi:hypothetical protein